MKKVKIILTAITVFAVVGGALAFKARTYGSTVWCSTSSSIGTNCKIKSNTTYTASDTGSSFCTNVDPGSTGHCDVKANLSTLF